jgi:hypothetical protein
MKLRSIIWSWDFLCAISFTIVIALILPCKVSNEFAHDLYGIGISVLSIVFSVFFAALAIIISSSDDNFVRFLEENGDYSRLINSFIFTLYSLFLALLYSLSLYGLTAAWIAQECPLQPFWLLVIYCFLFLYSLFAVLYSIHDSIKYTKYRIKYLKIN